MSKRRVLVVLVLGMLSGVMAFGVVGSGAWFTDQDSIVDNVVSAGTLSIDVRQEEGATQPFLISNLAPGGDWVGPYPFGIYNDGSLPALYGISAGNISETVPGFTNLVNVRLIPYFGGAYSTSCTGGLESSLTAMAATVTNHVYGVAALPFNNTHPWKMCFQLDDTADNTYQGASAEFDVIVTASQPGAP
jgi:hypothetical protein